MSDVTLAPHADVKPDARLEVAIAPSALAMAWCGVGQPHHAVAVPGVSLDFGELLVEIELATICGSDVHTVAGHRAAPTPLILGHEHVGRVLAVNGQPRTVDGALLRPGDRVVWSVMASCGTCDRCRRELPQKCRSVLKYGHERIAAGWELNGSFASHAHLRRGTAIVKVEETIPAEVLAPAACGTATAWAAIERADEIVDIDTAVVLVTGAGLIGLTATAMASDRGARVIVSDPDHTRAALARRFGAVGTVDPSDPDSLPRVLRELGSPEIETVIEASGAPRALDFAVEQLGIGGVLVLVGSVFPGPSLTVCPEQMVRNLVTIRGVHNYAPRDLAAAVSFLRDRWRNYPFAELVGVRFDLTDIDRALLASAAGESIRIAVKPDLDSRAGG